MRSLLALFAALILVGAANAATRSNSDIHNPRCQIGPKQGAYQLPAPTIVGAGKKTYLWAFAINKCFDPVAVMGTYACLEESHYPNFIGEDLRVIECHANIDAPVALAPHETPVYIAAKCDYTTIPRYYRITAYAWAVGLDVIDYDSRWKATDPSGRMTGKPISGAYVSEGTTRFCDISKKNTTWRDKPW